MLVSEKIEFDFVDLLQHNITINYGKKILKTGKLLLVSHKSTSICLTMLFTGKTEPKTYELPYPFSFSKDIEENNTYKNITLNYCLSALSPSIEIVKQFNDIKKVKKHHRFLENVITIKTID